MFRMDCFLFSFVLWKRKPNAKIKIETNVRLTPSAIANFLVLVLPEFMPQNKTISEQINQSLHDLKHKDESIIKLPEDGFTENERGLARIDSEHFSLEWLPQIRGLPRILQEHTRLIKTSEHCQNKINQMNAYKHTYKVLACISLQTCTD